MTSSDWLEIALWIIGGQSIVLGYLLKRELFDRRDQHHGLLRDLQQAVSNLTGVVQSLMDRVDKLEKPHLHAK